MGSRLVDREEEVRQLREQADAGGQRLILVHGRRRVGKTHLLRHAWEDRRVLYHLAVNSTPEQNRREFLDEIQRQTNRSLDPGDYPSWRTLFRLLGRIAGNASLVVVLDEFQYLLGDGSGAPAVTSELNAVWETDLADRDLTLVLCGSEVGTMRNLARGGALFGRPNREIHLRPFDHRQASAMMGPRSPRECAYLYGVFGGTPGYLSTVSADQSPGEAVREAFLATGGEVHLQLANLIEQEEGIRRPGRYRAVLAAIAKGNTGMNDIAQAAGFEPEASGVQAARRIVETLRDLDYVRRERNFGAGRTTPWRHYLADNALKFWYRYVHANRSLLELGAVDEGWSERIRPDLDSYMGWNVFEEMAREAYESRHSEWALPAPEEWSRWEGKDRNRRDIEIDIVCRLADGRMLTGEVKWSSSPVGPELHRQLQRDLEDLARSGEGWAREALQPERSRGHLYVSADGFTDEFRRTAEAAPRKTLVSLEEMYAD